jgi:dipeptidyl aminopeptidase/acylaminoacyl peptidase
MRRGDTWWRKDSSPEASRSDNRRRVTVFIRENDNSPPILVGVDSLSTKERVLLDLNPNLTKTFTLGHVEEYSWRDRHNRRWSGLLYFPVHYKEKVRFPVVLQTHGSAEPSEFSLYGLGVSSGDPGLGTGVSIYAAQALANRDIFVLQIEDKQDNLGSPAEAGMYMAAYECAVSSLNRAGLIDANRVGLVGFSRSGWHVEYSISHSKFAYAAALVADNMDAGYLQWLIIPGYGEAENGAPPFGKGLRKWLELSPGFNVDKIRTPLRLQVMSGKEHLLFTGWETFSRLRRLGRPVEMAVLPDIEHGSHNVQNPRQARFSQEGAVDWFDYWLNGRRDSSEAKRAQYNRWDALRRLTRTPALSIAH